MTRLPATRDIEAAAQRGQRAVAVDPCHRARGHVQRRMLERDPRLRRALDVELQHVAVVLVVHGRPPFMAVRLLARPVDRTTGLTFGERARR